MNARDIMTSPVIAVSPVTPVAEIRALLLARHISGVPVLQNDEIVGIVSESDLLHRYEAEPHPGTARSWWRRWVQPSVAPREYVRSHGRRAADVMSHGPVAVSEDTSLADVAALMTRRHIHRVPVLRDRRLVGIVTGSDLMKALPAEAVVDTVKTTCSDEEIERRLSDELADQDWWNPLWSQVSVQDGIVCYHGMVENEAQRDACRVAAENVAGVCGVVDDRVRAADWQAMA